MPASNELVFIHFHGEHDHFSKIQTPVFDDAADEVAREFPEAGRVVLAKVNCEREDAIMKRFHLKMYFTVPTVKIFRNGHQAKKDYKGEKSKEALVAFIKKELEDPVKEFQDLAELATRTTEKRVVIGEKLVVNL